MQLRRAPGKPNPQWLEPEAAGVQGSCPLGAELGPNQKTFPTHSRVDTSKHLPSGVSGLPQTGVLSGPHSAPFRMRSFIRETLSVFCSPVWGRGCRQLVFLAHRHLSQRGRGQTWGRGPRASPKTLAKPCWQDQGSRAPLPSGPRAGRAPLYLYLEI